MPKPRTLTLDEASRKQLKEHRDHDRRAYVRERAAALLKIADGASPAEVARSGLLRRRKEDTVYTWLNRYVKSGLAGLLIGKGRGRKPAFSPSAPGGGGC